ncbi:MAG: preprotein translocase subunit SecE [Acholeplasmatales bacterium]|nr:preprotein translocase subunit SecE [Acholeplasmatales bacterium]
MAKTKKVKAEKSKKPSYLKEVKGEMKKVSFPSAKEVTTYTIATIVIVALLIAFFLLLTALLSWVKGAF